MNLEQAGKASIIILTRDGLEYTRQCLESIFAKTSYPNFEVIIVDNASTDGTIDYLKELTAKNTNVQVLFNDFNEGFARGNNQGATKASGEYLVFLNNDVVVTSDWLTRLIRVLQDSSIGMVGPVTNSASNESKIHVTYQAVEDLDRFANEYTLSHRGESFEIRTLAFFCVALRNNVFREIGPLDERFGLGMFEDDDYSLRVKEAGYKLVCSEDVFIHHWGGASFLKLDPYQYWLTFKENRRKFEEKWQVTWQPHLQRAELLPDQVVQLSERVFELQWQLLAESQDERTDESFDIVVNQLIAQEHTIDQLSSTLNEIQSSNGWKIVQWLWTIRSKFFPGDRKLADNLTKTSNQGQTSTPQTVNQPPSHQVPADETSLHHTGSSIDQISPARVHILAPQFFDLQGETMFIGGAERYLTELIKLLQNMNYNPVVFQSGDSNWQREYLNVPFFGLNSGGDPNKLNVLFHDLIGEDTPVIYLSFNLATPYFRRKSIGISHGIYWDYGISSQPELQKKSTDFILSAFSHLKSIVSVDTNTINWLRTVHPELADKCIYIPNFVDVDKFQPSQSRHNGKLVVLYPRRLYTRRGFWLVHALVPEFMDKYPDIEFQFVGQADPEEKKAVEELIRLYPGRVTWETFDMRSMHEAYASADITLIPSLYSEGTSLSCLEAMASGNAVIASNVGGLPDLVISGYNGLMIEPSVEALHGALSTLCDNADLRHLFAQRGPEVAGTFNIVSWRSKWQDVIADLLPVG